MSVFPVEIVTPSRILYSGDATEVVLPAFDGERGILANHTDFIGQMGVGSLKIAIDSKEAWLVVGDGAYQVKDGQLVVLVEQGELSEEVDAGAAKGRLSELEKQLETVNRAAEDVSGLEKQRDLEKARIKVGKR